MSSDLTFLTNEPGKGILLRRTMTSPFSIGLTATIANRAALMGLVERLLAAKRRDPEADTAVWEREIDRLVYELYGLKEEEIKLVEESTAK